MRALAAQRGVLLDQLCVIAPGAAEQSAPPGPGAAVEPQGVPPEEGVDDVIGIQDCDGGAGERRFSCTSPRQER